VGGGELIKAEVTQPYKRGGRGFMETRKTGAAVVYQAFKRKT